MDGLHVINEIFDGEEFPVLTDPNGEVWVLASAVCQRVGLSAHNRSYSHHLDKLDADQKKLVPREQLKGISMFNMEQGGPVWLVSETGMYTLILRCRDATKPGTPAHAFHKWVVSTIRELRRKQYVALPGAELPSKINVRDPMQMATIATQLYELNAELSSRADKAETALAVAEPKAGFYDRFMDSEGLIGLQAAGRLFYDGDTVLGPRKFIDLLRKKGYLFLEGNVNTPYAQWLKRGLFVMKQVKCGDGAFRHQTMVTAKGLGHLAEDIGLTVESDAQKLLFI